jgi:hypothetical protein
VSELYPTQAEIQEWLNELWSTDPALYEYVTNESEDGEECDCEDCELSTYLIEENEP